MRGREVRLSVTIPMSLTRARIDVYNARSVTSVMAGHLKVGASTYSSSGSAMKTCLISNNISR
jgi:hypothetical protein